jgi:hypothetical protein
MLFYKNLGEILNWTKNHVGYRSEIGSLSSNLRLKAEGSALDWPLSWLRWNFELDQKACGVSILTIIGSLSSNLRSVDLSDWQLRDHSWDWHWSWLRWNFELNQKSCGVANFESEVSWSFKLTAEGPALRLALELTKVKFRVGPKIMWGTNFNW